MGNLLLSSGGALWFDLIGVTIVKLTTTCFSPQDCDLIGFEATIVKWTTVTMTTTCFSPQEGPILQEKRAWLGRSPLHRAPQWYGPDNIHCVDMWGNLRWNFLDNNLWKFIRVFCWRRGRCWKMLKDHEEGGEDSLRGPNCKKEIIVKLGWWRWFWWYGWSNLKALVIIVKLGCWWWCWWCPTA